MLCANQKLWLDMLGKIPTHVLQVICQALQVQQPLPFTMLQGARKMGYTEFVQALGLVAKAKDWETGDVRAAVVRSGGPRCNTVVTPDFVRLHDDKSSYTGASVGSGRRLS